MNIYIFIEIKKRELSSRLLLGLEAAKRGHDVYVGDLKPYLKKNLLKPGIVHHKSITPKKERISELHELKNKSFLCTSQDEESGHHNDHAKDYIETRYGKKSLELVEKVFTWGKFDYQNLITKYPKYKNKFFNTGNPKIDFWKNKYKNFFSQKVVNYKNFILISSNFETICGYRNLPDTIHWLRKLGYFERGLTEENIIERATKEQIIFRDFVKLIKKISVMLPKKTIIFRPHPIEKVSDWKYIFFNFKNIIVDNSNEIGHWITNSSLVIHNGCTGGLEAALRGKRVIAYSPKGLNIGHKFPNQVSESYTDMNSTINAVKNINKKSKILSKKRNKNIHRRFHNYYNDDAYVNIVNEWEKFSNAKISEKNNIQKLKILTNLLKLKLKLKNYKNIDNKFPNFNKREINSVFNNISKIDSGFKNLSLEILSGKLLRIYKK
jgi:surface carbohydrate biosynthesis protein